MWSGFDPELRRQLDSIRQMVALKYQTPTREWPLIFIDQHEMLLVVREWPDGYSPATRGKVMRLAIYGSLRAQHEELTASRPLSRARS
jgi:hypothetical protein